MLDAVQTQLWAQRLHNIYIRQGTIGEKSEKKWTFQKNEFSISWLEIEVIPG